MPSHPGGQRFLPRRTSLLVSFVCSLLFALPVHSQTILLPERWHFRTGDDSSFALTATSEAGWGMLDVPDWWEQEGYDGYDGVAWYRVHFQVADRYVGREMILLLGRIDDADETYLNGKRIGGMGEFPPHAVTAYSAQRIYTVPPGLLKRDNVLAVRVNDMMGPGGIVAGPIGLSTVEDYKRDFESPSVPRQTWHRLTTSNGLIAAVYDERRGYIESVRPHIFQAYDSALYVRPFVRRITPVLPEPLTNTSYDRNTHVIVSRGKNLEVTFVAPFTTREKIFYAAVTGPMAEVAQSSFSWLRTDTELLVDSLVVRQPGGRVRKYFLFGFVDSLQQDKRSVEHARQSLQEKHGNLIEREVAFMRGVIDHAQVPHGITRKERNVAEQSIAVLKMAQVGENEVPAGGRGEILASLPPGEWNIAWVRDGMYAVRALNRLRMFQEARRYLQFMLDAPSGQYVQYVYRDGKDYGVGVPYQVSVCRYFGSGREESDFNDDGPNIELDGFGMFLSSFADYVTRSGDTAFFRSHFDQVSRKVADAIVHCITPEGVIRIDSGPWERHLPGKVFVYPSITCAAGLRDFGELSQRLGRKEGEQYLLAYRRLVEGIQRTFVVDGRVVKGNAEARDPDKYDYFDGGTIEAFALKILTDRDLFQSDLAAYEKALRIDSPHRGWARINLGDAYETGEWLLLDLRTATTLQSFGNRKDARWLLNWVTEHASLNYNLVPELLNRVTGRYDGSIPMVGFGAGAYVLTLCDLYGQK
ncbi:MAG: beta galactosidase jelly roll domain-containing protein [Bacteroidota bacterium]